MNKPFIIAEMSANHLGSLQRALAIVDAAADSGADAIKLQTWTPDTMCIDDSRTMWQGESVLLRDLYRESWLPWEFHKPIFDRCAERGIECFSAPFDKASVDLLETLGCPRYKIASFELVDLDLIRYAASKGKPMVMSCGMATWNEIMIAVRAAAEAAPNITLLKCTSAYPADASHANLATMVEMGGNWNVFGLSDHTPGIGVAVAAAALGAVMIEKHLTMSRADGGPDAAFSMEPYEFNQMVTECRRAAAAIGRVQYGPGPTESTALRRSLYFARDIKAGEVITQDHLCTARPATGLAPHEIDLVIGRIVKCDFARGVPVTVPVIHD